MECEISGTVAQAARLEFAQSEEVWASRSSLIAHTASINWDVRIPGGLTSGLKRSLAGEGLSLVHFQASAEGGELILGANAPGRIQKWNLETDGPVVTTRGAFLAAWGADVRITASLAKRAGAAFFGGAGLLLQRIEGRGTALIHGRGDFREEVLSAGEERRVSTGNLAAFAASVDYDIETVSSWKKIFFGKEGVFMTRLQGPGRVLLQTLKPGSKKKELAVS